jgi:hypothetical protein
MKLIKGVPMEFGNIKKNSIKKWVFDSKRSFLLGLPKGLIHMHKVE